MANALHPTSVFLITINKNNRQYYLFNFDTDNKTASWTDNKLKGTAFVCEEDMQLFIATHFHSRNDFNFLEVIL